MINVLIADDSPTCLQFMHELLSNDPELRVIGRAADGLEAVHMTEQLQPNVVVMDLFMPGLNGFEATRQIMRNSPTAIVLVSATARVSDIDISMQALKAGALTIVGKPNLTGNAKFEDISQDFARTVKSMADVKVIRQVGGDERRGAERIALNRAYNDQSISHLPRQFRPRVVAIATSTGGPPALASLLSSLPTDFSLPILVVQHISLGFVEGLVDWLGRSCSLKVKIASNNECPQPGTVYLAPDNHHLGVGLNGLISLSTKDPIGGFRPSGTHMFQTIAASYGADAIAIILTGMGNDGLAGLIELNQKGSRVIAQDESSCVVFGMSAAAIDAGCVNKILPLEEIAPKILELCRDARRN